MAPLLRRRSPIAVVDSRPSDYRLLTHLAERHQWQVDFVPTAEDALRLSLSTRPGLWLINARLPDMPGLDLCEMLRERDDRILMLVVSDRYDVGDERRACQAGATSYLCKSLAGTLDCARVLVQLATIASFNRSPAAGMRWAAIGSRPVEKAHPP